MQKKMQQKSHSAEEPDTDVRKAFEEQAKELKKTPEEWRPSSKALGVDLARRLSVRTGAKTAK